MKFLIFILQLILPVFVYGVTDDEMIIFKQDAQNMFTMAKEDWIQNVKTSTTAKATFRCPDKENLSLCVDTDIACMVAVPILFTRKDLSQCTKFDNAIQSSQLPD